MLTDKTPVSGFPLIVVDYPEINTLPIAGYSPLTGIHRLD
jgi:hypothetical protein